MSDANPILRYSMEAEVITDAVLDFDQKKTAQLVQAHLARSDIKAKGTIVIGTVKGDNHDIGKNLVVMMLECAGYSVIDLGVNVSKGKFMAAAKYRQ